MIRVSTAAQCRAMDAHGIDTLGIPGVALMETASRLVAVAIRERFALEAARGVVVVCGGGNNGGDGYALARWLHLWGFEVRLWSLSTESSGDAGAFRGVARAMGLAQVTGLGEAGLVVDAVFGTGLARPVEGVWADVIDAINAHPSPVVAVDVPSGLSADTGAVLGTAVRADLTVTFARLKPGLLAEPGAALAGEVLVADIGLPEQVPHVAELAEPHDLASLWPLRGAADHKNRSGHLLVVAGSRTMAGAAILACRGAMAAGAGLVTLAAPRGAWARLGALPPEVMLFEAGAGDLAEPLPDAALQGRTAMAAGPGLGGGITDLKPAMAAWLEGVWREHPLPLVFDADALRHTVATERLDRVLTPHPGEAGRLLGCSAADVQADRFGSAARLAERGVALLKGRHTLVAQRGTPTAVNPTGAPTLATGGSGDVLTGIVGALLARGVPGVDAARLGAWVHGRAGELLAEERAEGWTAGDVVEAVPHAIEELVEGQ